eukprot:CAMPEP_0114355166 /NCGR_PEP_ID=MMETSP0101-20121206/20023_1 /TAXON_ID=38822 ORGANISM="Pteridomonas danica, Strain PT" /NCGR_SAMPLE_ID=MMETSP0101 /ASSEMBLY_ACC=CAM_ASM_000211 /LENGTH=97 /DNA_ID=CAMNT_0001496993 /DNA_START=294 /DNA_END=587 /DNA_ORIENTATION=+
MAGPSPVGPSPVGTGGADSNAVPSEESTALVVSESIPSNMKHASDHPRYRKFFKMLGMRIPMQACKQKMAIELPDEDVSILERPDDLVELLDGEEDE